MLQPAQKLCTIASRFESDIQISFRGSTCNAKSVLGVLGACIRYGDTVGISCSGPDELEALKAMVDALEGDRLTGGEV